MLNESAPSRSESARAVETLSTPTHLRPSVKSSATSWPLALAEPPPPAAGQPDTTTYREGMVFPSGRRVELQTTQGEALRVTSTTGQVELTIRFTDAGPVLSFASAGLDLQSVGPMTIDCESLAIRSRGDVTMEAASALSFRAEGPASLDASEVDLKAREGELRGKCAGEMWLNAKVLQLNCEREPAVPVREGAPCCYACIEAQALGLPGPCAEARAAGRAEPCCKDDK
jgi:hypothetical protein